MPPATREIRNKSHVQLHRWGGGRGGGPEAHTLGTHTATAPTPTSRPNPSRSSPAAALWRRANCAREERETSGTGLRVATKLTTKLTTKQGVSACHCRHMRHCAATTASEVRASSERGPSEVRARSERAPSELRASSALGASGRAAAPQPPRSELELSEPRRAGALQQLVRVRVRVSAAAAG